MNSAQCWNKFFCNWPSSLARKGVIQTVLNETMQFKNFWLQEGMVLFERIAPDATGARFVLVGFDVINLVKFVDPLTEKDIADAGFHKQLPKRVAPVQASVQTPGLPLGQGQSV